MTTVFRATVIAIGLCATVAFAGEPTPAPATSAPAAAPAPGVPGNSFVMHADALRAEAFAVLGEYVKVKHSCNKVAVLDTRSKRAAGKVAMDRAGNLVTGTINETWKVDACGKELSLSVVLSPAKAGAPSVAISER